MGRLIWQMTTAVRFSTPATDGSNRAAAKIPEFHDLRENSGASLYEIGPRVGQNAPPFLTYYCVRILVAKKES